MKIKNYHNTKKEYHSPELIQHGSVEEITKGKNVVPKEDGSQRYSMLDDGWSFLLFIY